LPLDVLMEEGAVGFILVAAPIGLLIALALRRARRRKAPAVAALATATLVLVHASVDWTWTVPAIGVPFFLLLGAAIADDDRPRLPRRFANPAAAVVALATLLLLFPPWISARLTDNVQAAGGGPDAASDLKWARRLDPLSLVPDFVEARYAGSVEEAARALERAVEKEPRYGVGHYHLGVLYLRLGRYDDARSSLQRAAELIPGDATVQLALAQTRRR
jgi:tetratricopeptide (TPR) repeat protein